MQIHNVKREHQNKAKKRVGRGGKRGKTSGRGTKGQKARSGRKMRPELRDIIKKIPKLRGRGKNSNTPRSPVFIPVNLKSLEVSFAAGELVSPQTLAEKGIIRDKHGRIPLVKILGAGVLTKNLAFSRCAFSASAKLAIEKAGGSIR